MTAQEKLERLDRKYADLTRWQVRTAKGWRLTRYNVHNRMERVSKLQARRILAAAREKNGPFTGVAMMPPGHTCNGTVAGAYACAKCQAYKVAEFPLNAWAKLREQYKKDAAALLSPPKPRARKAKACPHCGGSL